MDQQPKIPTLKDAQKPQVKIKGLGAGLTIFDRLKQFKKKDLAFILAGLGTLFMAPLAEHFMMAPETGSELSKGFGSGSGGTGGNFFGSGSSPYETTGGGIAQGGAIGGAGDIITPLNVRDPSALVMGPGQSQQPPAGSAAPVTPPPTAPASSADDYKDALKASASRAAGEAVKKAPLPVPKVALGGSGLRGLGVAGGGSSASGGGLGPINSGNLGQAGTGGGGLNLVRGAPAYKGVAGARGPGNPTGLDGTKKAGQNAGDAFSRTGSALSGLNAAASEQIPTGASGFGGGGQGGAGANDKSPGGSGPGGSKSVGESLAFLEAKQRMEENLKLEFEKRKLKDPELLMYGIRNDALKLIAGKMSESLAKSITGMMDGSSAAPTGAYWECLPAYPKISASTAQCDEKKQYDCMTKVQGADHYQAKPGDTHKCVSKNGKGDAGPGSAETAVDGTGGVRSGAPTGSAATAAANLKEFCDLLDKEIPILTKDAATNATSQQKLTVANSLQKEVGKLVSKRDALYGSSTSNSCKAEALRTDKSVYQYRGTAVEDLLKKEGLPGLIKAATDPKGTVDDSTITSARDKHTKAKELLQKVDNVTVDMTPFETQLFRDGGGTFQRLISNAKSAKEGIDKYAVDERGRLGDLEPLIKGAELAGSKQGTPTVPEVVKVNLAYDTMAKRAEAATGEKPGTGVTVEEPAATPPATGTSAPAAKPNPETEAQAVMKTVDTARQSVEGPAIAAVTKIEDAKKADPKYVVTPQDKQPITDAWKAWGAMQKEQGRVLSAISGSLTDMKDGKTPAAPTSGGGTTTAAAATAVDPHAGMTGM